MPARPSKSSKAIFPQHARAGDVYVDYSGGRGSPIFGHGPDFGYWYYANSDYS